jgi:NAD(P)-dependent dehydrogenase (short-subunit alcohol dehydrogenase family)
MLDGTPALRICSLAPGVIDTDMQAEIRASALDRFPQRARFDALKRDGALADPAVCARQLVDFLLSEHFGKTATADLREIAG